MSGYLLRSSLPWTPVDKRKNWTCFFATRLAWRRVKLKVATDRQAAFLPISCHQNTWTILALWNSGLWWAYKNRTRNQLSRKPLKLAYNMTTCSVLCVSTADDQTTSFWHQRSRYSVQISSWSSFFMPFSLFCLNVYLGCHFLLDHFLQVCIYLRSFLVSTKTVFKNLLFAQSATHCTTMIQHMRQLVADECLRSALMLNFQITDIELTESRAMKCFWKR